LQISQLPSSYVYYLSALAGPLIAGLAVYIVLSYLFVPLRITTPLAIIISVLVFGLSKYYANNNKNSEKSGKPETTIKKDKVNSSVAPSNLNDIELKQQPQHQRQETDQEKNNNYINKRENIISKNNNNNTHTLSIFANLFFVVGYAACLLIVTSYFFIFNPSNEEIFVPWEQFTIVQIIQVGASIALCFFLPGYAILSIYTKTQIIK
jgi:ABC-type multidrug transport system fused ATPase/permease subunit